MTVVHSGCITTSRDASTHHLHAMTHTHAQRKTYWPTDKTATKQKKRTLGDNCVEVWMHEDIHKHVTKHLKATQRYLKYCSTLAASQKLHTHNKGWTETEGTDSSQGET